VRLSQSSPLLFGALALRAVDALGDDADAPALAAAGTQTASSNVGGVTQSVDAIRTAAERVRAAAETGTGQGRTRHPDAKSFHAKMRAA
jgi:hypothetical protein